MSDVINIATGWYGEAFREMNIWVDQQADVQLIDARDMVSRYYVRLNAMDKPGTLGRISTILGEQGISIQGVIQHEQSAGEYEPLVITTHEARRGALDEALAGAEQANLLDNKPVCIRIVEMPEG